MTRLDFRCSDAAGALKLRIPQKLSVAGFGNLLVCSYISLALVPAAENRFELARRDFPYAIRIGGDFESRKFAVSFKENEFISPEIFVEIHLKPGETRRWSRTYRFRRPPTPEPGRTRGGTSSAATRTHGGTAR